MGRMKTVRLNLPAGLVLFLFLVCADRVATAADATNQWKIEVKGLRIVAPTKGSKNDRGAFMSKPGVTVAITLSTAAGTIVNVSQMESKLESFTDDKGTDLIVKTSDDPFEQAGVEVWSSSSDKEGEGKTTVDVDLKGTTVPAKGASVLNISGKLAVTSASGKKQFTTDMMDLKPGTKFNAGDLSLTITEAGAHSNPFSNGSEFQVTFSSAQNLEAIAGIEFSDAQGNKIEARRESWGSSPGSYFATYALKKSVDRAKMAITCWQDLKTTEVPISIKTGLGL